MANKTLCPICGYPIYGEPDLPALRCQCMFIGSCHPNRVKKQEVAFEHLYLFNEEQINHLINLQRRMQISYSDDERTKILNRFIQMSKEGTDND